MCGRFTQLASAEELAEMFELDELPDLPDLPGPRYNLAPSQQAAVVLLEQEQRRLAMLRWGLIPGGARDPGLGYRLINARSESAAARPAFRRAFARRRCLVPVNGFFEWAPLTPGTRRKRPWLVRRRDGAAFALAGLWERWQIPKGASRPGFLADEPDGNIIRTFTILTTGANELVAPIHDRMPVVVPPDHFERWLTPGSPVPAAGPPEALTAHPVRRLVNDPAHDTPACITPLTAAERAKRRPRSLFG